MKTVLLITFIATLLFACAGIAKVRAIRATQDEILYSFPVAENTVWTTTAKFIATKETFHTTFSPPVISPPLPTSLTLLQNEQKKIDKFGSYVRLSEHGYGYYIFSGAPDESRADFVFDDKITKSSFTIPAINQFANFSNETGVAYGLYSEIERKSYVVIWGEPRDLTLLVYDEKVNLIGIEAIKASDFIENAFTHYEIRAFSEGLCSINIYSTSHFRSPIWGVVVSGYKDGSSQDVIPIRRVNE